jgi:hypothetical protein
MLTLKRIAIAIAAVLALATPQVAVGHGRTHAPTVRKARKLIGHVDPAV